MVHRRRELPHVEIPVFSIGVWGKAALHLRGNFYGFERVSGPKKLLVAHRPDSPRRSSTTSASSSTATNCCPGTTTTPRAVRTR